MGVIRVFKVNMVNSIACLESVNLVNWTKYVKPLITFFH